MIGELVEQGGLTFLIEDCVYSAKGERRVRFNRLHTKRKMVQEQTTLHFYVMIGGSWIERKHTLFNGDYTIGQRYEQIKSAAVEATLQLYVQMPSLFKKSTSTSI